MEERRQKEARHKKTEIQMAKLFTSEEEKGTIFIILFILFCHNLSQPVIFYCMTEAERRLKDALRKKKERQMAKPFTSEKEKGTNFMIYFSILCTLFIFPLVYL